MTARNGNRWTPEEYQLLGSLCEMGKSWWEISKLLGRSKEALKRAAIRKGLKRPRWRINQERAEALRLRWGPPQAEKEEEALQGAQAPAAPEPEPEPEPEPAAQEESTPNSFIGEVLSRLNRDKIDPNE